MKAKLEFNLPEESNEHRLAIHGQDWALVAWDLEQKLRDYLKYGHKIKTADDALAEIRSKLHNLMEEHGVGFDMIE